MSVQGIPQAAVNLSQAAGPPAVDFPSAAPNATEPPHLFQTHVYICYFRSLQQFAQKNSDQQVALAQRILLFSQGTEKVNFKFYQEVLLSIRQQGNDRSNDPDGRFAEKLSRWIYLRSDLLPSMIQMAEQQYIPQKISHDALIPADLLESLFLDTFAVICKRHPPYSKDAWREKLHDPHFHGNIPYKLCKLGNVQMIRMPNILRDLKPDTLANSPSDLHIIEEFYHFLNTVQAKKQIHLYVNLLSLVKHEEGRRMAEAIHAIECDVKYAECVRVITLDRDSDWYWQRGTENLIIPAEEFIQDFLSRLFNQGKGATFLWSQKLNLISWRNACETILRCIHHDTFKDQQALNFQDRRDFIENCYARMIRRLFVEFNASSANITCMHSTDRGPNLFGIVYVDHCYATKKHLNGDDAKMVITVSQLTPLLVQNRPAHDYRFKPIISLAKRLSAA